MPQGLPNRIRDAFTLQAVVAGITLIVCVMAAALVATSAWMVWSALAAPSTAPENAAAGARPIDAQG